METVSMLKGIYYDQAGFISGMQDWFFIWKSITVIHYISKTDLRRKIIITTKHAKVSAW